MSIARRAVQLLPTCASTGIGSLPHSQGELALQTALAHDIPYLPQLPTGNPGELMIASALDGVPGLRFDDEGVCTVELGAWEAGASELARRIDAALATGTLEAFEPSVQACRSWRPFLFEVQARKLPFAKVQIAGPTTVRWVAKTSAGTAVSALPALDRQVYQLLLAKSLALVKAVRRAGATPVLFLDEPGLYAVARGDPTHAVALKELEMLIAAVQREGALVGVHCCGNTDWAAVLSLGLDILSTDARLSLDAVLEEREQFLQFVGGGATMALGIVPTDLTSTYSVAELCESVEASLRASVPKGVAFQALLSRMLVTPACGLAMRSVKDAERIIDEVREAQRTFRELARG
jgi:methionine synthase II (cobalamin-independent)